MSDQEEELSRRLHAARLARLAAQKTRLLALERAEKLELDLKGAAEIGVKAQILRTLAARAQLQAIARRQTAKRVSGTAVVALLLAAATSGLAWVGTKNSVSPSQAVRHAPVLGSVPGEPLKLAYSYSVSLPPAR